jgi:hypothetical protein
MNLSIAELVRWLKEPGQNAKVAHAGVGSFAHLCGMLFAQEIGAMVTQVPYRGAGPALLDLLGGQVQVMFASMSSSIEYVRAGKLRALAVTIATRSPVLPDLPTVAELWLLLAVVAAYKRKKKASDAHICRWLHKKSYPDVSPEALRRALQDARNPKRNSVLAQMADLVARKKTGTKALDEAVTAKGVGWVIENADALWELWK